MELGKFTNSLLGYAEDFHIRGHPVMCGKPREQEGEIKELMNMRKKAPYGGEQKCRLEKNESDAAGMQGGWIGGWLDS